MKHIFFSMAALLVASVASATSITGRVVYVDDGDTLVLLDGTKQQVKVRLANIDAPETSHTKHETGRIGQPFAEQSRKALDQMVKGKDVIANCIEQDRYQRQVCDILVDGVSANTEQVRRGYAWANTANKGRYLRDRSLLELQERARLARAGLWADSKPVPPWEWRKRCWTDGQCAAD